MLAISEIDGAKVHYSRSEKKKKDREEKKKKREMKMRDLGAGREDIVSLCGGGKKA